MSELSFRNRLMLVLTAVVGIVLSFWSCITIREVESARLDREFSQLAQDIALRTQSQIEQSVEMLSGYRALFAASSSVSRIEYRRFSSVFLPNRPEVFAVHWSPRVKHINRVHYEAELKRHGLAPIGIFDVSPDASTVQKAPVRDEYFPIYYAEPLQPNRSVVGLDPLARPYNQETIRAAALRAQQVTTPAFPVVQNPDGPLAVAIYQPIYGGLTIADTETARLDLLTGYIIMMMKPAVLLDRVLDIDGNNVELRLIDATKGSSLIYPRHAPLRPVGQEIEVLVKSFELDVPGRQWQLRVWPKSSYLDGQKSWQSDLTQLAVLLLTLVAVLYLARVFKHNASLRTTNQMLQEKQVLLDRLAYYDPLTQLPNRTLLEHRLTAILNILGSDYCDRESIVLCALDLDEFKPINDSYGHKAGDYVLQQIAVRINNALNEGDMVARLGGDEFVLLLSGYQQLEALEVFLHALLMEIAQPVRLEDDLADVSVTASIGVVSVSAEQLTLSDLMHKADMVMYQAKSKGKNRYAICPRIRFSETAESAAAVND